MSQDLNALRNWVTAESGGQARGETTVLLHCTHSTSRLASLRSASIGT